MSKRIHLVFALTIITSTMVMAQTVKLREYHSKEFNIGLKYPANWQLDTTKKPIDDEPGFTSVAVVSPPESSVRGRLHDASATIALAKVSEAACHDFTATDGGETTKPVKKRIGSITFYNATGSDIAAGSAGETDTYRTFHDGKCYEINLMTVRQNGLGADRYIRMAGSGLRTILRTFYFAK
jgi:hypothetical protein